MAGFHTRAIGKIVSFSLPAPKLTFSISSISSESCHKKAAPKKILRKKIFSIKLCSCNFSDLLQGAKTTKQDQFCEIKINHV